MIATHSDLPVHALDDYTVNRHVMTAQRETAL